MTGHPKTKNADHADISSSRLLHSYTDRFSVNITTKLGNKELYCVLTGDRAPAFQIYSPVSSSLHYDDEHAQPNTVLFINYFCMVSQLISTSKNQT